MNWPSFLGVLTGGVFIGLWLSSHLIDPRRRDWWD